MAIARKTRVRRFHCKLCRVVWEGPFGVDVQDCYCSCSGENVVMQEEKPRGR